MDEVNKYQKKFIQLLQRKKIHAVLSEGIILCTSGKKKFPLDSNSNFHHVVKSPQKLSALIQSKLGLNKTIFARNCEFKRIAKPEAEQFLDEFHMMNSTSSAFNYGLFIKNELIAVASFSKGRRMNRLAEDKRSFELIRFCCKEGITVIGGLTKLVKNFCREKDAGDVMTYVDKQFSQGDSFTKAGFVKHSETEPNYFLVDNKTFEIRPVKTPSEKFDPDKFYLTRNFGNVKLVYTPNE